MNNVLLIGNGFDLAHGLLTKYKHFLELMKNWNKFYSTFLKEKEKEEEVRQKEKEEEVYFMQEVFGGGIFEKPVDKYLKNVTNMDKTNIDELGDIINKNSWIKYYCSCEAEIDGWIDFEREIYPVIKVFEKIFLNDYVLSEDIVFDGKGTGIDYSNFTSKDLEIAKLWQKYIFCSQRRLTVKQDYVSRNYGVLKKNIIKDLKQEFDEFIYAFEIYLHEFVLKNDDIKPLEQITKLDINSVISFNYTLTEKLYGITEDDVHHIHGKIRQDMKNEKNNMVMGVGEAAEQNMDFIYFVKYFQRIKKSSGTKYKELMEKEYRTESGFTGNAYKLYIYGHSLDETDKDIITYAIGTKEELARGDMRSRHVTIFYYDEADYEQKVINLIKLYGRNIVESYIEAGYFELIETSSVTS